MSHYALRKMFLDTMKPISFGVKKLCLGHFFLAQFTGMKLLNSV